MAAHAELLTQLQSLVNDNTHLKFANMQRGIEKESLRINTQGLLSQTPHPQALGASLTHPQITTDYSEALLEFITGVHTSVDDCLQELHDIHTFTYQNLDNELLWVNSMPCFIAKDTDVPIATYGSSNIGQMKHIYRIGLEHRYGRKMQAIAGVHYNFSLDDDFWVSYQTHLNNNDDLKQFKNQQYLHLIRNFHRHSWLLIYLFSASPAICESFVKTRQHSLEKFANGDLGHPHGMCLRMSNLGYQSSAQDGLIATYNSIEEYVATLLEALTQKHQTYEDIGLKDNDAYKQLSTHLLQIENEFYSIIRPKTVTRSGEAPLTALVDRGIEYIEVRCLDLNPLLPLGINAEQINFIDAFLVYCLLSPSPTMDKQDIASSRNDFSQVVKQGLNLDTPLSNGSIESSANALMKQIKHVCEFLDTTDNAYQQSWAAQQQKISDPNTTLAATILDQLMPQDGENTTQFHYWALAQSKKTQAHFKRQILSEQALTDFKQKAAASLTQKSSLEHSDSQSFDVFLTQFYQQYDQL